MTDEAKIVVFFAGIMLGLGIGLLCGHKIAVNQPKGRSHAYVTNQ